MTDTPSDEDPRGQQAGDSEPRAATPETAADHMIGSLSRSGTGAGGAVAAILAAAMLGSAGSCVSARMLLNRSNDYETGMAMMMGGAVLILMALAVGAVLAVVGGLVAWAASERVAAGVVTALVVPTLVMALVIGDTSPPLSSQPREHEYWERYELVAINQAPLPVDVDLTGAVGDLQNVTVTAAYMRLNAQARLYESVIVYRTDDGVSRSIRSSGRYSLEYGARLVDHRFFPGPDSAAAQPFEGTLAHLGDVWDKGAMRPKYLLHVTYNGALFTFEQAGTLVIN